MDLNTIIGTVGSALTYDHILRALGSIVIERDQLQLGLDAALGRGDDLMLELDDARHEIARLIIERDQLELERAWLLTTLRPWPR